MKKRNLKSRIDNSFLYDLMLFRDIELDLKKEKRVTGKQNRLPKGKKASTKERRNSKMNFTNDHSEHHDLLVTEEFL